MGDVEALKAAGMDIDSLPPEQQEALKNLDQSEIDALVAIREKLNEGAEVSGYAFDTFETPGSRPTTEGFTSPRLMDGNLVW